MRPLDDLEQSVSHARVAIDRLERVYVARRPELGEFLWT